MRYLALLMITAVVASGTWAPAVQAQKPAPTRNPNVPRPRQGGDTVDTAVLIEHIPFSTTGTTTGFSDDHDAVCPYDGSTSPDVVYRIEAGSFSDLPCRWISIDLAGSSYDTKVYLMDSQMQVVACNDDFYSDFTSLIDIAHLFPDETYYLVVDGYGGDHGEYELQVSEFLPGYVGCHDAQWDEGELPLQDDVPDTYNSGCDGDAGPAAIVPIPANADNRQSVCGRNGWTTVDGELVADIDWFSLRIGAVGVVDGSLINAVGGMLSAYLPGECGALDLLLAFQISPLMEMPFTITGEPGQEVWLRMETSSYGPACDRTPEEWEYNIFLEGLQSPVGLESRSWSQVKGLFHR